MHPITRGRVCWNCKHSRFAKQREGDLIGRGRGHCLFAAGKPPFTQGYHPPAAYWRDVDQLADSFEAYLTRNAPYYHGHKAALNADNYLYENQERFRHEYACLCWLKAHRTDIVEVSWQDVCPHHEFLTGRN